MMMGMMNCVSYLIAICWISLQSTRLGLGLGRKLVHRQYQNTLFATGLVAKGVFAAPEVRSRGGSVGFYVTCGISALLSSPLQSIY
ncbi:unnamed protein product [Pieris brassicae]|uniref:Uncharacterized protein n=1 Tax=Pieris brassicae TaxID=7116 RepID=A0A9P0XFP4_PIEBR|nr:unnamed protein product [Pieris brassicae]